MAAALFFGVLGGLWAAATGVLLLINVLSGPGRSNLFLLAVLIFIILMGAITLFAAYLRAKFPRLALSLVWTSTLGLTAAALLDPGWLMYFVLPSAFLTLPFALTLAKT